MKIFNRYTFYARYLPGLIALLPLSMVYFFLSKIYSEYGLNEYAQSLTFIAGLSAVFVLTYFVSMIVRELGSYLENQYFKRSDGFPTTYLMFYDNQLLPLQVKLQYNARIKSDYNLIRLTEAEEIRDKTEAIKILEHATRLLSTKYQHNPQITEANIAYGFSRNVCGGLFISIPGSVAGIIVGVVLNIQPLIFWSALILCIYVLIAILHKRWIFRNAEKYAQKLFSIYLADLKE